MPKQDPATGAKLTIDFTDPASHSYEDTAGQTFEGPDAAVEAFSRFQQHNEPFDLRGVNRHIREARPYTYWTPEEPEPLQEAWFPHIEPKKKATVTRWARQTPGYVINRHAPPGIGAGPVCAEIKPKEPIETDARSGDSAKYVFAPGDGLAKRLDAHPMAVPLLRDTDRNRVFFGIEGCLKADAILSQGEAVFSVPSVSLWRAPELPAFARKYLKGKTVFIVPDADWHDNWMVKSQAIQCQCYLLGLGIENVYVAAPPKEANLKGVDDFLAAGNTVEDMVVVGREMPAAFEQWAAREARDTRLDGAARDAELAQALSMCAGMTELQDGTKKERQGQIYRAVRPVQRVISAVNPRRTKPMDRKNIREAFDSLSKRPGWTSPLAISIDGSLDVEDGGWEIQGEYPPDNPEATHKTGRWSYFKESDWKDMPTITVAAELRAIDRDPVRVGDLLADNAIARIEPFLAVDVSPQRLRQLRDQLAVAA